MAPGRLFQVRGPAMANDLSPLCVRGSWSFPLSADLIPERRSTLGWQNSNVLLTERCRTNDLLPDLPVSCLPPRRVDSKVLGLNVMVDRSQPGCSWDARRVSSSQMAIAVRRRRHGDGLPPGLTEPGARRAFYPFRDWQTACDAPNCLICSVPGVWYS